MRPLPSLILFARVPEAGRVKTRLADRLGAEGAARLYEAFLRDAARVYLRPNSWHSVLCAEPDPADPRLSALFGEGWRRQAQATGDLGERLRSAFEAEFQRGSPGAVAIGSDHPALPGRLLDEAFGALEGGDGAVLIPAEDGGYCAIGLSAAAPVGAIFAAIPWSTAGVLDETAHRLDESGVVWRRLEAAYDVDRVEDLERLRRDLRERDASDEDYPRATADALEALT